ncbi:MAG: hypothetical protein EAZ92_10135 [Candidatus Kapaibacterium sp.]|nr:MAG: hypothetical protein EAZ92_10135 [Candidatus Kapabacteria bacterium]
MKRMIARSWYYALVFACMLTGLLLFSASLAIAQKVEEMRLERISEEQGLSSSIVNTIFQDSRGILWFGAFDGLNEYDGLHFRQFHQQLPDSLSTGISTITALEEDYTGALWCATRSTKGISRFNTRTQSFDFIPFPASLRPLVVRTICEDADKTLWIGTSRGLLRLDRRTMSFQPVVPSPQSREGQDREGQDILQIIRGAGQTLWLATPTSLYALDRSRNSLRRIDCGLQPNTRIRTFTVQQDSLRSTQGAIHPQTRLWIGTDSAGVRCIDAESGQILASYTEADGLTSNTVFSLLCLESGEVWAGTNQGTSILNFVGQSLKMPVITRLQPVTNNPYTLSGNVVQALFEDASGVVWAASEFYGLNKYARFRHKFRHISVSLRMENSSLSSNYVRGIAETPANGTAKRFLWFATQTGGLNRFTPETNEWAYFRKDKLGSDTAWALRFDGNNTLWIGLVHGGLWSYNVQTQAMTRFVGISADAVIQVIYVDKQGMVWVAGDSFPLTSLPHNNTPLRQYSLHTSNHDTLGREERILCVLEDRRGRFLVGTDKGLREFDRATGKVTVRLSGVVVSALYEDASEALWVGTRGQGLQQYRRVESGASAVQGSSTQGLYTSPFVLAERDGLPNNTISMILCDAAGLLWVSTKRGLVQIDPEQRKVLHVYDTDDGLQGNEFHRGSGFYSASGEMFFGGANGANAFIPTKMLYNQSPPPVIISSVKNAERSELLIDSTIQATRTIYLRHDENTLTFSFVGLDFNSPERNIFAYKLDGLDKAWIQSGTSREATYTSLEPGEYTFRVRAANNDGVWNEEGATMQIVIAPPIWRTWWFIGLSIASVVCIGFVAYRARIRGIEARNELLEKQVTTRTSELREANVELQQINHKLSDSLNEIQILSSVLDGERNKSEDLLLNILPPSIAERLKWGETTIVDTFESATVLFSDMVGFTKIASRVTPEELIIMLNRMFSVFDQLAEVHGVEKIKTIGDAYMAVAGVPIPNDEHAAAIAAMALDMQLAIKELAEAENLPISIRVGMHSGYLTAGVIGEKKFAYDLWGDTVNTASRMESSGEAGRVQCSEATYLLLKEKYDFEERGMIEVKGKGAMKTYFLVGKKS